MPQALTGMTRPPTANSMKTRLRNMSPYCERPVHCMLSTQKKMEKLAAEMNAKQKAGESPSMADIGKMYTGAGGLMVANNAEMEVVKSGGGNWAEHEWVKQQLRIAHIQQGDGSDANAHNYKLYKKYEDDLGDN